MPGPTITYDSRITCKSQRQKNRLTNKQGDTVLRNKAMFDRYDRFCRLLGNSVAAMDLRMKMSKKMGIDRSLRIEQNLGRPIQPLVNPEKMKEFEAARLTLTTTVKPSLDLRQISSPFKEERKPIKQVNTLEFTGDDSQLRTVRDADYMTRRRMRDIPSPGRNPDMTKKTRRDQVIQAIKRQLNKNHDNMKRVVKSREKQYRYHKS